MVLETASFGIGTGVWLELCSTKPNNPPLYGGFRRTVCCILLKPVRRDCKISGAKTWGEVLFNAYREGMKTAIDPMRSLLSRRGINTLGG